MDFFDAFNQSGILAKLSMLVAFGPPGLAIAYVLRPSERKLAIMRPVSLAAIFAGISGLVAGLIAILMGMAATPPPVNMANVYVGLSEALVAPFVNFGSLGAAWLLVAVGMMRRPHLGQLETLPPPSRTANEALESESTGLVDADGGR